MCPSGLKFDERPGEVAVIYVNRITVLWVIYCPATELGKPHAPLVEHTVLSVGKDAVGAGKHDPTLD